MDPVIVITRLNHEYRFQNHDAGLPPPLEHAVLLDRVGWAGWAPALCGTVPWPSSNGWSFYPGEAATCPDCAAALLRPRPRLSMIRLGGIPVPAALFSPALGKAETP